MGNELGIVTDYRGIMTLIVGITPLRIFSALQLLACRVVASQCLR